MWLQAELVRSLPRMLFLHAAEIAALGGFSPELGALHGAAELGPQAQASFPSAGEDCSQAPPDTRKGASRASLLAEASSPSGLCAQQC